MSLLSEAMTQCEFLNKSRVDDGYGGYKTTWTPGATFDAAIVFDTSIEARRAESEGVTSLYTITTRKDISLEYHDVIRRLSDNKIFRISSDGDDVYTPKSATLNMRQVTAEEWTLPSDEQIGG